MFGRATITLGIGPHSSLFIIILIGSYRNDIIDYHRILVLTVSSAYTTSVLSCGRWPNKPMLAASPSPGFLSTPDTEEQLWG